MNKKYINLEIENNINEKGFSVYNYISFGELMSTIQRDYLKTIKKINLFFGFSSVFLGLIVPYFLPFFFIIVYSFIFIYLFYVFIIRSYYFLLISDVVYTKKGIIIGSNLLLFSNEEKINNKLLKYEKHFDEYLSKESKLGESIKIHKKKLFEDLIVNGKKIITDRKFGNDFRKIIFAGFLYLIYAISLFIFYYIGLFLGFIFFFFCALIIKVFLYFRKNIEIKIKTKVEDLDKTFEKMEKIYLLIESKVSNFKDGEISNISNFIGKNFELFYSKVLHVLKERKRLLKIIERSKYKDFIDFEILEKYIFKNFNKPINEMISLLSKIEKKLEKGLKELEKDKSNISEYDAHFKKKEIILQNQLEMLKLNKNKLEQSLLTK